VAAAAVEAEAPRLRRRHHRIRTRFLMSQFFEVAGRGYPLPLPAMAAELKKKRMAEQQQGQPGCVVPADRLMQYHNHPQPRQIVQTKNLMLITYESTTGCATSTWMAGRRRTTTRRRGGSATRAAGMKVDTLVVETTNFRGDERAGWLDVNGSPYTEALKNDRGAFVRPNFGTLEIDIHDRRSQGVHEAVHRARQPEDHG
jgi:hypothetical protein